MLVALRVAMKRARIELKDGQPFETGTPEGENGTATGHNGANTAELKMDAIAIPVFILTTLGALVLGFRTGIRDGIWTGIAWTWVGLVIASVGWAATGIIIKAESLWDLWGDLISLVSPWDINIYLVMLLCLPAVPFLWLQEGNARRPQRRRAVQVNA
jgi:hypothetical protein